MNLTIKKDTCQEGQDGNDCITKSLHGCTYSIKVCSLRAYSIQQDQMYDDHS